MDVLEPGGAPDRLFVLNFVREQENRPLPWPANAAARIEWAWKKYCRMMEWLERVPEDNVPFLDTYTGTEIFAEALGAPVHRFDFDMPCARPLIRSATDVGKVKVPEIGSSSLATLFDMADALRARAGNGALLRLPDIQSPMDIAATMWDKTDFYMAIALELEAVQELASKIATLLCAFLDEWFERYGKGFVGHCPDCYMPSGVTFSEDEVGVVSPGMFETLFLPELVALHKRYGPLGMHCCANARHQWDGFRKIPGLRLLNLVQPPQIVREAYTFFDRDFVHAHSWFGDGPPETWLEQLPRDARVVFTANVNSEQEAQQMAEKLWNVCGR